MIVHKNRSQNKRYRKHQTIIIHHRCLLTEKCRSDMRKRLPLKWKTLSLSLSFFFSVQETVVLQVPALLFKNGEARTNEIHIKWTSNVLSRNPGRRFGIYDRTDPIMCHVGGGNSWLAFGWFVVTNIPPRIYPNGPPALLGILGNRIHCFYLTKLWAR